MEHKHPPAQSTQNEHKGHRSHHEHMVAEYKRRFKICLFLTIPVLTLSPMIQSFLGIEDKLTFPGDMFILFLLASVVYFYGGWPFLRGLFTEVGSIIEVSADSLVKGNRFIVKPGEKVPTDGSVVNGGTTVNESMLTGESVPVRKGPGDAVVGGAINNEGSITVMVEKVGEETFLSRVVKMVREAQETRSRSQDLANRAALWLTVIALSVGSLTLVVWLVLGQDLAYAMERMVTVMVITCPHALGLAVPLVVAVSTSLAATRGLLLRDRAAF